VLLHPGHLTHTISLDMGSAIQQLRWKNLHFSEVVKLVMNLQNILEMLYNLSTNDAFAKHSLLTL